MESDALDQREDFRQLVDHLDGVAIWVASSPERFDYISDGFEDVWGIPAEEVEDDPARLLETIHPDDRERVRENMERASPEESYVGRVVRPDGSVRWLQNRQILLPDDDGGVEKVVGISTDITEQKRREEELDALNRVLRHDIRNDVNVVVGWAELLADHVDEEGEPYRQRILDAGERVIDLTEVARDYAKTVTSGEDLDTHPVSLRDVLEHAVEMRRESYPDAEFVVDGEVPDVEVTGNEMLESVFRNLLNNAVQHNDEAEPVVEVSCEVSADAVAVRVADNGPGIPDHQKEAIFEQGEAGIGSQGTGVGLYLVRTLVEQYDGSVSVADNDPKGTVFTVTLPLAA
ncbi:PAS domain-containing sensor histidine kinase [Halobacterium sp. CBA1126]|uniref:PAS domain-containing sensor histidine kinase n=1 Tax=Halobacterium sp. CBA1126 TaxID=2668074 RepID=UPI0012FAE281|nr:PAS domain-containing sensor histidine kinase [Halobacterium sp. CBA1126]MUV61674.1 PAS domain S-box protein [Halobacterium sp. CBA1126]